MRYRIPGECSPAFAKSWKAELPLLPKWARENKHVAHWAYENMPYRARVMSCKPSDRQSLIHEAENQCRRNYG